MWCIGSMLHGTKWRLACAKSSFLWIFVQASVFARFTHLMRTHSGKGGGIIDMMNRRLRERLTEAEILQIFVDVCECVAAMHNLRPALLHRDPKVENVLQASNNVFKLCDFGVLPHQSRLDCRRPRLRLELSRRT